MWVIWFGPMVVVAFLAGLTIAAVLLRLGKLRSPRRALAAAALPFAFAALPVLILSLVSLGASAFSPDDRALYTELFGPGPTPAPSKILAEAYGKGASREILLSWNASATERDRLMHLPGLTRATTTPEDFAVRGIRRGLDAWWMRPSVPGAIKRAPGVDCLSPTIYQADGFNGWRDVRIAVCAMDRGDRPPLFIAAYGH